MKVKRAHEAETHLEYLIFVDFFFCCFFEWGQKEEPGTFKAVNLSNEIDSNQISNEKAVKQLRPILERPGKDFVLFSLRQLLIQQKWIVLNQTSFHNAVTGQVMW